jgi:DNA-binding transcriptional ArsR family regulator
MGGPFGRLRSAFGGKGGKGPATDELAHRLQRRASLNACEAALAQCGLDHPLANEALEAVREGRALSPDKRQQLLRLIDEWDARCVSLWEPVEGGHTPDGEWRIYFTQARAASALWFATSDNSIGDAQAVLYEAWHAAYRGNDIPDTAYTKSGLQACMTRATPEVRWQVMLRGCEVARAQSGLDHPVASEALEALREARALSPERRGQVRRLVAELDARYSELQELAAAGNATDEDCRAGFRKARAASALWLATSGNPIESAQETVYDAWLATDCGNDVPDLFYRLLG